MAKTNTALAPDPSEPGDKTTAPTPGPQLAVRKFIPKVVKVLTVPLLKLREGSEIFVSPIGPMFVADDNKHEATSDPKKPKKEPPTLLNVTDLETGELRQIILGTILKDIFLKYEKDSYVGKGFWIRVLEKKKGSGGGDGYNTYDVREIEVPA